MAWLAAPHGRRAAHGGDLARAAVGEAAPAESHRHARRLPAERLDLGAGSAPARHRRLPAVAARAVMRVVPAHAGTPYSVSTTLGVHDIRSLPTHSPGHSQTAYGSPAVACPRLDRGPGRRR